VESMVIAIKEPRLGAEVRTQSTGGPFDSPLDPLEGQAREERAHRPQASPSQRHPGQSVANRWQCSPS